MKLMKKLTPVALATSMALGGLAAPGVASAEVSANMAVANFYLWRGQDLSAGAPQVSGGFDYAHESGAYAGIWATSEEGGHETDLYIGYAGEISGFSYDISFWEYLYPSDNDIAGPDDSFSDSDVSELIVSLGYGDFALGLYFGNDTTDGFGEDYEYITLDYAMGDINFQYGMWKADVTDGIDDSHLTVSYAYDDNFTFTVSKGFQDDASTATDEDILWHVAYSLPFDMK